MNNDEIVKKLIWVAQNTEDEYIREESIVEVLEMFKPFRHSLSSKFSGKGVEFDDICQVIDLKLIEGILDYDERLDSSAIRHITSKARNGIFNYYKKEMNYFREDRKTVSIDNPSYYVSHNGFKENIYYMNNLDRDNKEEFNEDTLVDLILVRQELDSLTDRQKELINMYYMEDMTQEEIAEKLNINQANVSRTTKRGVRRLKETLNPLDEHDGTL